MTTKQQIYIWLGLLLLFTIIVIVLGMPKDCTSPITNVKSMSGWFKSCPATTTEYPNEESKISADAVTIQMNLGGGTLTAGKVNGTANICINDTCIEEKHLKVLLGSLPFGIINSGPGNWLGREHKGQNAWFHDQYDKWGALYFRNMGVVP